MYHQVGNAAPTGSPFRELTVTPENFRKQMQRLKACGYRGLSLANLRPYLLGRASGRVVGLTFDDGFANVHDHALPVLEELDFSATCFFVSGEIGGYNRWDAPIGVPYARCMTRAEMLKWAQSGNEIGAHTVDHVHLTRISPADAFLQIMESRRQLEDLSGRAVTSFAYPYGDVSMSIRDHVAEAGFSLATTTQRGRASSDSDPLLLPRRNIRLSNGWIATLRKSIIG